MIAGLFNAMEGLVALAPTRSTWPDPGISSPST